MKKTLKNSIAFILAIIMVFGSAPLSGIAALDFEFPEFLTSGLFSTQVAAETEGIYTYEISGGEVTITDCVTTASGDIIIPDTLGGWPVTSIGFEAFYTCSGLTSVIIPDSVMNIEMCAFSNCYGLKIVTIPESVMNIGCAAFDACEQLIIFGVPGSTSDIYANENGINFFPFDSFALLNPPVNTNYLLNGTLSLAGIQLVYVDERGNLIAVDVADCNVSGYDLSSLGVQTISVTYDAEIVFFNITVFDPDVVFIFEIRENQATIKGFDSLYKGELVIPSTLGGYTVSSIGGRAFYNCSSLITVTIPDGVKSIGDESFSDCSSLSSVIIPDSVSSIGGFAFYNCSSLITMTIPDSVTSIGDFAFNNCTGLTNILLGSNVQEIGHFAFLRCCRLLSITIPASVFFIGQQAFSECTSLTGFSVIAGNPTFTSEAGVLFTNDSEFLFQYPIAKTGAYAIPESVNVIGRESFEGCAGLTAIIIPESVFLIEMGAFENCTSLKTVTIPNSVMSIDTSAFKGCTELSSITIGTGVTRIVDFTFYYCSSLTSVIIPDSVTSIGNSAFTYCTALSSINIPNKVASIGDNTFSSCSSLTSVIIPDSVTSIGDNTFSGCSSLTSVILHNSVLSIGSNSFSGCTSLTSIAIPNKLASIGDNTFSSCSSLTSVIISDSVTSIGKGAFRSCSGLSSVVIPNNVTSIGFLTFYSCTGLSSITFKSATTSIYDASSTIPAQTKIIGYDPSTAKAYAEKYGRTFEPLSTLLEKKAIYFLPGYMGSKLYSSSTDILAWMSKPILLADIINFNNHFGSVLSLDENGNSNLLKVDREKDNSPNGDGSYFYGTSDMSGNDTAATIMNMLKTNFLKENGGDYEAVKFYSYDWRKSLKVSADELQADIDSAGYDKVVLVCHSTGGLLAAEYIAASTKNQLKVEKVVTLGSPLLGTYDPLTPLETGSCDSIEGLGIFQYLAYPTGAYNWIKHAVKNTPCTYQLLPSNEFISSFPIGVQNATKTNYHMVNTIGGFYDLLNRSESNLNSNMIDGSGESHKKYRESYVNGNIMNVFKKVNAYHIAGVEPKDDKGHSINTEIRAKYTDTFTYGTGPVKFNGYDCTTLGDGTVTQFSACGIYMNNVGQYVYPESYGIAHGVKHFDLVTNPDVLEAVVEYIKTGAVYTQVTDIDKSKASNSVDGLVMTGAGMSETLVYRVCGNVDISALDSAGTQVAFLNKEGSSGFLDNGLSYNYINADLDEVDLLLPNTGFKVIVSPSTDVSGTVDFTAIISTLQPDGGTESTVNFSTPLLGNETLTLNAIDGINKSNVSDVILLLTKSDLSTSTVEPDSTKTDYATNLTIDENATIVNGNTQTISAVVVPSGIAINWQSSDETVVTVDANGTATAIGYGKAQITAMTSDGSKFATCYVTVPCLADSISYSPLSILMTFEEKNFITPVFTPAYATNTTLIYTSDNETVATVDADGMVSALKVGMATITATTNNGKTAVCTVTVQSNKIGVTQSSALIVNDNILKNLTIGNSSVSAIRSQIDNSNIKFIDNAGNIIPENCITGTGSKLQLLAGDGSIIDELKIVIFGDVNGDGNIDSIDAGLLVDYENYLVNWDPVANAANIKSSDLNGDGNIDSIDAGIAVDAENYIVTIDQKTGLLHVR